MLLSKATLAIIIAAMPLLLAGFNALTVFSNPDDKMLKVTVSVDFLKSIVSPIVGELGEVYSIVSGEVEPHSFTLTSDIIQLVSDSDLIVITGHMMWEEELIRQAAEVKGVSSDLISVNMMNLDGIRILNLNGDRNIHGFWLLPDNALIIAREVKEKISALKPELSKELSDNYERFKEEIISLKNFLHNLSSKYYLYNRSVVIGFYAEQYVAEAMGLKVGSMLIGEGEGVRPASLRRIYEGFKSGEYACLIVSDVALLMEGVQSALEKISEETGCPIAYVLVVSTNGLRDYSAIMYYNAGQVYSALLSKHKAVSNDINLYLMIAVIILLLAVIFETSLLVRRKAEI